MATIVENPLKQEEEINSLREHFKDDIRILSSIGQFSYILKIRADQYDVSLTLQLDKFYPNKTPEIMITAPRLSPDQILLVQQLLQNYSEALVNQPMIFPIYTRLLKWFDENKIQTLNITNNNTTNTTTTNNTNHNQLISPSISPIPRSPTNSKPPQPFNLTNNHQNKSISCDEHEQQSKKSLIKTAEDIFQYLETNSFIDKHLCRIGYLDQNIHLQEQSFDDFHLSTIPKTHIQYFKYANEIIWDRESRTDLIFTSTGNQQTIFDIIKRHESKLSQDYRDSKQHIALPDVLLKPNYILSIPLTDPSFISHYLAYREHFLSLNPNCSSTDPQSLHLTLLTLHLESPVQIDQCIMILKRIQEEIHYHCSYPERICLEFNQIELYKNEYIYLKCQENLRLENLRQLILTRFREQQEKQKIFEKFFLDEIDDFHRQIILFKKKRKFDNFLSNSIEQYNFGKQTINALHLSSITTNENEQQLNHCIFKLDLS